MTNDNDPSLTSNKSQAFKSAVKKLMQVPHQELIEKLAEVIKKRAIALTS